MLSDFHILFKLKSDSFHYSVASENNSNTIGFLVGYLIHFDIPYWLCGINTILSNGGRKILRFNFGFHSKHFPLRINFLYQEAMVEEKIILDTLQSLFIF